VVVVWNFGVGSAVKLEHFRPFLQYTVTARTVNGKLYTSLGRSVELLLKLDPQIDLGRIQVLDIRFDAEEFRDHRIARGREVGGESHTVFVRGFRFVHRRVGAGDELLW